ncbi:MAG: hypothetical protein M2R45_03444 [Verrucomicrobia subdivision 3 bacterium]|nr:hypothetical protein [Limisphaerales bacterium]MCS1415738.1 hypothetical protein [Limisphaerales bacterium]
MTSIIGWSERMSGVIKLWEAICGGEDDNRLQIIVADSYCYWVGLPPRRLAAPSNRSSV